MISLLRTGASEKPPASETTAEGRNVSDMRAGRFLYAALARTSRYWERQGEESVPWGLFGQYEKGAARTDSFFPSLRKSGQRWSCLVQVHTAFAWGFGTVILTGVIITGKVIILCPRESYRGHTCHKNNLSLQEPSCPCGLVPA